MTDTTSPPTTCRNCGTTLLGSHCYRCGQPVRGLIRPLSSLFNDALDSVLNIDTRLIRTLGPLYANPGFLTTEYFAGRQVRYVTPVRLFIFLCILAFFVGSLTMPSGGITIRTDMDDNPILAATSEADVINYRDAELARLASVRNAIPDGSGKDVAENSLRHAEEGIMEAAQARITQLREAAAKGEPTPPPGESQISFGDQPWDATTNPVHVPGAPAFLDEWVNAKIGRAKGNIKRLRTDPASYKETLLSAIPTALFILVPVFALLLKTLYLFKRRLYMEHLVVTLHSHAFISLQLLLIFAMLALQQLVRPDSFFDDALAWAMGLLVAWIPLYLLLMQKRVYGQGWLMTLLKFFVLGTVYVFLLSFAISAAAVASLVWM